MLNMNEIEFSIIIPVFNQEKYIEKCILSALEQDFKGGYEIIAVNDGSTDKSKEILDNFKDREKLKIFHNENHGVSYSRNFALKVTKGNYIVFLDADDYLDKSALKNIKSINPENTADIILAPFYAVRENKGDAKKFLPLPKKLFNAAHGSDFKNIQNTEGKILEANFELCTKAYRKDFLKENNIEFQPFKIAEDLPFFYNTILNAKKILICKKPVYFYRKGHKKGFTPADINETINAILAADKIVKKYSDYKTIKRLYIKNTGKVLSYWCKKFNNLPNRGIFYTFCLKLFIRNLIDI